jgi:AbrB family looped-hinge helix DNA binding protein
MLSSSESICRVRVDGSGRIVIPVELRDRYGIGIGDELIVTAGESALAVQTLRQIVAEAQAAFAPYRIPGHSIVDELIAERRAEAARENDQ